MDDAGGRPGWPTLAQVRRWAAADAVPLAAFGVFFVAGVVWLLHTWDPVEDLAITELAVRQVGSDTPLAGAYSSLPFRHPGPLLFLTLWGPYELFGERSSALLAATLWVNGAVLALVLGLARRLGGTVLPIAVAGAVCLWADASGFPRLLQPWNPYVGALPVVALVFLAWAMVEQRRWALPIAVGLGTWTIQAHIQFVPVTLATLVIGLGGLVAGRVRASGRAGLRDLRGPVAVAVGLGLLLWSPVLLDVLANGSASNPGAILRHYQGAQEATPKRDDLWLVLRSALSLHPTWAGGPRPYGLLLPGARMWPLAVPLWIAAAVAAWRRRAHVELRGMAVAFAALAASLVALTGVTGRSLAPWYLISVEATSLALDVVVAGSLVASVRAVVAGRRRLVDADADPLDAVPDLRGRWAAVAGVAAVALVVATTLSLHRRFDEEATATATRQVLPAVEAAIPEGRPVLLEARSGLGGWLQAALVLDLDKAGYRVFAKTTLADKFPAALTADPPEDAVRFVVITKPPPDTVWADGVEVVDEIAYSLSPGEEPLRVVIVRAPLHAGFLSKNP